MKYIDPTFVIDHCGCDIGLRKSIVHYLLVVIYTIRMLMPCYYIKIYIFKEKSLNEFSDYLVVENNESNYEE